MPRTYEPIQSTTLGSAAASITFSNIPSIFTDLVLVCNYGTASGGSTYVRFNGDTAGNYSWNLVGAYSAGASANAGNNQNLINAGPYWVGVSNTITAVSIVNISNYSNANVFKSALTRYINGTNEVNLTIGTWRNTNAITSIVFGGTTSNLISGSTATLYGIRSA